MVASADQSSLEPTSPRSVEAFMRLGIEPESLRHVPLSAFRRTGEAADLAQMMFDHTERVRQASFQPGALLISESIFSLSGNV